MTQQDSIQGFCAKDNRETDMAKGCRHPQDYCQHRSSCMIHFLERQKKLETEKTAEENSLA